LDLPGWVNNKNEKRKGARERCYGERATWCETWKCGYKRRAAQQKKNL
jgi:hypothetical protein